MANTTKKSKKVDVKKVAKLALPKELANILKAEDKVVLDGENFGFTEGTLVVRLGETDIQVKFITPKAGVIHYEELVDEDEEIEEPKEEKAE